MAAARLMEGWEVGKPVFQEPPGAPSPPPGGFLAAGALQGPMVAVTSAPPSPTPSPGVTPTCRDPSVPSPSICPARPLPRPLRKGSGWLDTDGGREEGRTLLEPPGQARKSRGTFPRALSVESCLHPRVTGSAGSGGSGPVDPIPPPPRPIREAEGKWDRKVLRANITALCLRLPQPPPRPPHSPHLPPRGSEGAQERVGPSARMCLQASAAQTPVGRLRVGGGRLRR